MRVLLFANPTLANGVSLLSAFLRVGARRRDVELVGVVDIARSPLRSLHLARTQSAWALRRLCNVNTAADPEDPPHATVAALARRRRIPLLAPLTVGINGPEFVDTVRRLRPDIGISLMVDQVFRAPLLEACGTPVNYHPGLLPHYRGIGATGWSIYKAEARSGFSFHLMSDEVDRGAVLLQDGVALDRTSTAATVERSKTRLARTKLNELFDLLLARRGAAAVQSGPGSSFRRSELLAMRTVEEPERLTLHELELRLRAFEVLELALADGRYRATALRRVGRRPRHRHLVFTTADGVAVEPSRLLHVPPLAYGALERVMQRA